MRAAVVPRHGPPEVIEVRDDWPDPGPPGPGEVMVRVLAAGLNPSDTKIRAGRGPGASPTPYVSGREAAGLVLATGPEVTGLEPGDEVFAFFGWDADPGGHAERLVTSASGMARRPSGIPLETAAGLPLAGLTALQALETLEAPPGERVLVTSGSGGVGHLAVQLACLLGFEVVATTGPTNLDFVSGLGARTVLDYHDPDSLHMASGIGYMVDSVGGENIAAYQDVLADRAVVSAVAGTPPSVRAGLQVRPIRCRADGEALGRLSRWAEQGDLTVTVQETFPLPRVVEAHRLLEAGHVRGKLVIVVA